MIVEEDDRCQLLITWDGHIDVQSIRSGIRNERYTLKSGVNNIHVSQSSNKRELANTGQNTGEAEMFLTKYLTNVRFC